MHRSVLENGSYAKFAAAHTVEMLVTEEMDRALAAKNPLIKTYKTKDPYGDAVDYLVHFPGVTIDQLRSLSNSAAINYIAAAKKIPYTAIVDPHTLKEMEAFTGVYRPDDLIQKVKKQAKVLVDKHGKGVPRKVWNNITKSEIQIDMLLGQTKIVDAMGVYTALARRTFSQPKIILNRVSSAMDTILDDAEKRLQAIEKEAAAGRKNRHKREAGQLARALKDTPLAAKANALVKRLK